MNFSNRAGRNTLLQPPVRVPSDRRKTVNTVTQLIAGQAEIDRMRREIDQVCGSILGYMKIRGSSGGYSRHFDFNVARRASWTLSHLPEAENPYAIAFDHSGIDTYTPFAYSTSQGAGKIGLGSVKIVHEGLDKLVLIAMDMWPDLGKLWQPIFEAAPKNDSAPKK